MSAPTETEEKTYYAGYEDGRSSESGSSQELQQRSYLQGWSDGYDAAVNKLKRMKGEVKENENTN